MKRIFILIGLLLLPSVLAITTEICLNTSHLQVYVEHEICDDDSCETVNDTQIKNCTYGCSDNTCLQYYPKTSESYPWVIVGTILIAFVFAYVGVTVRDEYGILKAFFLSFALTIVLISSSIIKQFAIEAGLSSGTLELIDTIYGVLMWSLYFFITYFVLSLLIGILDALGKLPSFFEKGKRKWGRK